MVRISHQLQGCAFCDAASAHLVSIIGSALKNAQAFRSPSSFQRSHGIETSFASLTDTGMNFNPFTVQKYASSVKFRATS